MEEEKEQWWSSRGNRMRVWFGLLVLGIAGVALVLWSLQSGEDDDGNRPISLSEGQSAPDFSLPAAGGGTVSLDDFRGQKVLLYFSMGSG